MNDHAHVMLERIRRRDLTAIAELVGLHQRQLRGYVAVLCADVNSVDDLAQEVFVRALERLDRVADLEDFGHFLRGIARNVVREDVRWRARRAERYAAFVEEIHLRQETAGSVWSDDPALFEALRRCVEKLSKRSQQFLRLRYWEEKRAEEIGRKFGLSGGAVRIALLRIREALIACLRSAGAVPEGQA